MEKNSAESTRLFPVAEHFASINGEGARAGEPAYFIRFTSCNLQCSYCDTAWANAPDAPYEALGVQEIMELVREAGLRDVTLTGGEPLLQKGLEELLESLLADGTRRVEIETNGSVSIRPFLDFGGRRPVFTLDYKLPGSGMEAAMDTENYQYLEPEDSVKFVVSGREDMETACRIINTFDLAEKCNVFFSPVFGRIEPVEIVDFLLANRLNGVRLNLQLHKIVWDPDRRGV
ncbi:MAG: putative 7-carboxy-7-deazaguanine synthase QueE [Firmicutes bacterium]|nr:putative 7-carboxy-7-deazaguanine synthase QueE [Bacillota bacterium]